MIIEIEDYRLIQDGTTFNLVWITKSEETIIEEVDGRRVRTKTGRLIDREVDFGYNMQLELGKHVPRRTGKITKLINNQI